MLLEEFDSVCCLMVPVVVKAGALLVEASLLLWSRFSWGVNVSNLSVLVEDAFASLVCGAIWATVLLLVWLVYCCCWFSGIGTFIWFSILLMILSWCWLFEETMSGNLGVLAKDTDLCVPASVTLIEGGDVGC